MADHTLDHRHGGAVLVPLLPKNGAAQSDSLLETLQLNRQDVMLSRQDGYTEAKRSCEKQGSMTCMRSSRKVYEWRCSPGPSQHAVGFHLQIGVMGR